VADYTRVLEGEPDAVDSYVGRAKCLARLGQEERAIADLTRALELVPTDASVYLERGQLLGLEGHDERAVADLTKSLELGGPPRARVYRGRSLANLKRYDEAIADHDAVLAGEVTPEDRCHALLERGQAFAGKGQHDRAVLDFDAALGVQVGVPAMHSTALMNRAWSNQDMGRPEQAVEDLGELLLRWPDHRSAHGFRAVAHEKAGNWAAALADHLRQRDRSPDDPIAWGCAALVLAACPDEAVRNGSEALALAARACELSKWSDHNALDALAAAHAECSRFDEAVSWATKALELAPEGERAEMSARLEGYRAGRPYRVVPPT
jgi:serine/threonine-protein kinase